MARRTVSSGLLEDTESLRPWDSPRSRELYVGGRYDDSGPLRPLLWADLRRSYRRNKIPHLYATIFEMNLFDVSIRRLAEAFRLPGSKIQRIIAHVRKIILADPELAILTLIYEDCGGWDAVSEYLSDPD